MLEKYATEEIIYLAFFTSLLLSFLCFLKCLTDNRKAWSNIRRDKALAIKDKFRISEAELLGNAWFGGLCGLLAMVIVWHKVKKPSFVCGYLCRTLIGATVCLLVLLLYAVLALPPIVSHWSSARNFVLFLEWSYS